MTQFSHVDDGGGDALVGLDAEFDRLYAADGRLSVAPKRLIRASLLQILFSWGGAYRSR